MSLENAYLVGVFVVTLFFLAAGTLTVIKIVGHLRGGLEPKSVPALAKRFASRESVVALTGRVQRIEEGQSERTRRLHEKIEAEMKDVHKRIDGVPERVITLLKTTGVIK